MAKAVNTPVPNTTKTGGPKPAQPQQPGSEKRQKQEVPAGGTVDSCGSAAKTGKDAGYGGGKNRDKKGK